MRGAVLPAVEEDESMSSAVLKAVTADKEPPVLTALDPVEEDVKDAELPYIAMFSVHGLIRGTAPELGRDLDTGGQITYVLEVVRKLSGLATVDLFTRLIDDPSVDDDYKEPKEELAPGINLIRIRCGPGRYIRKELLWQFFPEFIDRTIEFIKKNRPIPICFHGHYADGALVAAQLSDVFAVPLAFTGHSMGRTKLRSCLKKMKYTAIASKFKMHTRVEAEERALQTCNLVIANSVEEINTQWRLLYDGFHAYESMFQAVALKPGVGMKRFIWNHGLETQPQPSEWRTAKEYPAIWKKIDRFLDDPNKPVVLLLARPAPEKNMQTMVECFGECDELRAACNLVIIAGQRKDIDKMPKEQRECLETILKLIDKFDLYGSVAYPKTHSRSDVPAMFALPAYRGGAFANIAHREPFGLTLIEAAVNGAPILATTNGAGTEIVEKLQNGFAVKPTDKKQIIESVLSLCNDKKLFERCKANSIKYSGVYSWDGHVSQYMKFVRIIRDEVPLVVRTGDEPPFSVQMLGDCVLVICDIDNTLLHPSEEGIEYFRQFVALFRRNKSRMKLALSTGRSINSAVDYISSFDAKLISECTFLITSVGCEIHYWQESEFVSSKAKHLPSMKLRRLCSDEEYHRHLSYRFSRHEIALFIAQNFPDLELQSEKTGHSGLEQRSHKLSYCLQRDGDDDMSEDDEEEVVGSSAAGFEALGDVGVDGAPLMKPTEPDGDESGSSHSSGIMGAGGMLRAPSMVDLARVDSADSLYSLARPASNYGLAKLGIRGGFTHGSLLNLQMMRSMSSGALKDTVMLAGGITAPSASFVSDGSKPIYRKDFERENRALNKYLHGTDLEKTLKEQLRKQGFVCEVIVSHDKFVDVLPIRASKGKALRYLLARNGWTFERVVVAGDSGNDTDMLAGLTKAIVVGNYSAELSALTYAKQVYFAKNFYAGGVVEGLKHYFPLIC